MNLPRLGRRERLPGVLVCVVACGLAAACRADLPAPLAGSGLAVVPADAAFLSATLRGREQFDRFVKSNAYAALKALPAVRRALESAAEQRSMPGNPLSMVDTFLQLPENAQAADLLADMVATDTFVYGEPSCVAFARLARKLAAVLQDIGARANLPVDDDMEILEETDDDGEADARPRSRAVRCQVEVDVDPAERQQRLLVQTLVDNIDLIVMPDVVWGFTTTKPDVARAQITRLEGMAKATLGDGADGPAVARRQLAGGEFLVLTVPGEALPWGEVERGIDDAAGDIDGFEEVFATLRSLDLCVAVGVVGDRVILSLGDGTDHLDKLAVGGAATRLLSTPALAPLLAHAGKPLTAVSYLSEAMMKALAQSADDMRDQMQDQFDALERMISPGIPDEAMEEAEATLERAATAMAERLPVPGAWTGFSFLTDAGYEGYAWDWSTNQPVDGGRRLDILEHTGGAPLAVAVTRVKSDPGVLDDLTALTGGLFGVLGKVLDREGGDFREFAARFGPLGDRLVAVVRDKLVPALADGQMGFVIDAKSRTKKPQRDLPGTAEPLPLPEAAIVLPLADAALFRDGLSDLFELGDDTVAAARDLDPDAVPDGYEVPDPEKAKVEAGTVWSFPLPESGLDDQVRPAIGVGEKSAVFSLVPKQAARLLAAAKLETGAQLATFEEPLAAAAAIDVAGVVDALKPWVVYVARYRAASDPDGSVDADTELAAADETAGTKEILEHVDVVAEVAKCLRAAVAETTVREGALVTHWRNIIRDLPAKP